MISIKRYQKIIARLALCLVFSINLLSEPEKVLLKTIDAKNILTGPNGELKLEGNVYIKTNLLEFWSDRATYNKENQSFKLAGNVKVLSKNLELSSKTLAANLSEQTFMLKSSSFVFQNSVYGKAKTLKILKSGNIELLNTSFNSCSLDDPVWDISSKKITLIEKENKAIVRGLKFKIGNVPILYIPYLQTPIGKKRLSGFLTPSLKQGKDGVDIALPYYFNLAPNYDLTLSPRYIEERGEGIGFNFRYLNSSSTGEILLNSLNGDRKYKAETGADLRRWRGSFVHTSNSNNQLFSEIKYEDVYKAPTDLKSFIDQKGELGKDTMFQYGVRDEASNIGESDIFDKYVGGYAGVETPGIGPIKYQGSKTVPPSMGFKEKKYYTKYGITDARDAFSSLSKDYAGQLAALEKEELNQGLKRKGMFNTRSFKNLLESQQMDTDQLYAEGGIADLMKKKYD